MQGQGKVVLATTEALQWWWTADGFAEKFDAVASCKLSWRRSNASAHVLGAHMLGLSVGQPKGCVCLHEDEGRSCRAAVATNIM